MISKTTIKNILTDVGTEMLNFAKGNEQKNYTDGRVQSADFDEKVSIFLKENSDRINGELTTKYQSVDGIKRIKILIPEKREFFDISLTIECVQSETILINAKYCSEDKNQHNNLNGGWKLIDHLLGAGANTMNELVEYCSNNKNIKCVSDYYILEIPKDLSEVKCASIFDGGIAVNAAQTFPGLQYNINKSKWSDEHKSPEEKAKMLRDWLETFECKFSKKAEKFKIISGAIYQEK